MQLLTRLGLGAAAVVLLTTAGLWLSVLLNRQPLNTWAARIAPWPVACTTRGCVTTQQWARAKSLRQTFANTTGFERPADNAILTTLLRQHLVRYAQLRSTVTASAASRYREDVLNIASDEQLLKAAGLTLKEYDEKVIRPFLEEEGVRQARGIEKVEDLWPQLAQQRRVVLLLGRFKWNREAGAVE